MTRNTPNLEPIRTCEKPKTEKIDRDKSKYEPIRTCEKPKTEKDDRDKAKSKPAIIFKAPNTEKAEKNDIASKPDDTPKENKTDYKDKKIERSSQKPKVKPKNKIEPRKIDPKKEPKNKIEPRKIDIQKESRHKIQPRKSNPLTPPRNKIEPRKVDIQKEPRHKIQRQKSNPLTPPRNKIEPRRMDIQKEPEHRIQHQRFTPERSKNKIEPRKLDTSQEPKNKIQPNSFIEPNNTKKPKVNYSDKQKLFNDGKQKECGRCHQIKLHNEFELRNDSRKNKPYLRSNCNQCKNELKQIYLFRNKHKILTNIYNGKFKEKCPECETKVNKLPAFDFHHPDKSLKGEQRIRTYSNWMKTKEMLEKEKVIPLCKNCHAIKQATVFNENKEIILKKNNFEKTIEGIDLKIHQYTTPLLKNQNYDHIRQTKSWIKKRIVIENLYNGKCVGCGENNLPTLQFHHKDPKLKTYKKWSDLSNLNISKIMKKVKEDDAVCLCANCHSMTESSQFKENMSEIVEKRDISELKAFYKNLNQNLKNYSFPNQPEKQKTSKLHVKSHNQNKIQPQRSKIKIERIPTTELKNTIKPEVSQLSLEKIKGELKKFNWKTISENWTVKVSVNKEITLKPYELPSKENPLYKHKQWLQTVYNHKTWNLNDNMLRKISGVSHATIYNWRRKLGIPTKQAQQKLFKDGTHKECGRCHQIKSHNEFKVRNDKRKDNPYLRSNCNQCKSELNQIYLFKNKRKILTNIYNGKFKEKCPECETKVSKLPAFDFHHPDKNFKVEQRIRTRGKWKKTMEMLEQEKVIPLCKNCHLAKKTTVFNKFKENILRKNNYETHLTGIENNIHQYIKKNLKNENNKHLIQIKSWIKKRIVVEKLYKGGCIGCGESNLPALQFHHRNPKKKSFHSWTQISFLNISEIMEKLVKDNAVCLCGTCHNMAEARHFKENMSEIVESKDLHEIKTFYEKLNRNINNYSFPKQLEKKVNYRKQIIQNKLAMLKEIEPRTHLNESIKYQTSYGEAWKKYLFHINKLINERKVVQTKILAESVGVNTRNTRKIIQKLIAKGMISINGEHNNRKIFLTERGRNESKKNFPYIYI